MTVTADQQAALEATARIWVEQGWRIESQMPGQVVVTDGKKVNHLLHFLIGVFTIGLWWLFVWLPLAVFGGEKRRLVYVDDQGLIQKRRL